MSSNKEVRPIRLSTEEKEGIMRVVLKMAQETRFECREISLFGSRINPDAKGGDIDLYIKIKSSSDFDLFTLRQKLRVALKDELGDQKIELIIDDSKIDLGAFKKLISESKVILLKKK